MIRDRHRDGPGEPSAWILSFAGRVPVRAEILDLAAGAGRHTRLWRGHSQRVTAIDRDISGLADLERDASVEVIEADLEAGRAWPLGDRRFDLVLVTNYLWRPLLAPIVAA